MGSNSISIDIDMLAGFPTKTMLALVTKQRETKKFLESSFKALEDFPTLFLMLEEMDIDVRFDPDYGSLSVNFTGDGPRLGKLWGELRRNGFSCESRPKKGDTSFSGTFRQEGYPPINVYFTSSVCRRVQVGTQTVEQPIYETICGEELNISAAESQPVLTHGELNGELPEIPF